MMICIIDLRMTYDDIHHKKYEETMLEYSCAESI
jgi:hypothetical protein